MIAKRKKAVVKKAAPAKPAPTKPASANAAMQEILLAGSGGQGVILTGKMLAQAAVAEGFNVTYIPSYGVEVRGGTANCHIKIGHGPIGSPFVEEATLVLAMNEASYLAFSPLVRKGATLVVNASLVPTIGRHPGVKLVALELTKIASELGSLRSANMLALGLCAGLLGWTCRQRLIDLLAETFGKKDPAVLEINQKILEKGLELAEKDAKE
jgi:2-oxoglutarate ferredoxin oxidoreductase subunit gamma